MMLGILYIANYITWPLTLFSLKYSNYRYLKLKRSTKLLTLNNVVKPVNVPCCFHDPPVNACLSIGIKSNNPSVGYSINNLIMYKIFSHNKFTRNLDGVACIQGSNFTDTDPHYIDSGYLQIIKNNKLGPRAQY